MHLESPPPIYRGWVSHFLSAVFLMNYYSNFETQTKPPQCPISDI